MEKYIDLILSLLCLVGQWDTADERRLESLQSPDDNALTSLLQQSPGGGGRGCPPPGLLPVEQTPHKSKKVIETNFISHLTVRLIARLAPTASIN